MGSQTRTILENFGHTSDGFDCVLCDKRRKYYDLLSDNSFVCLECSVKGGYELDVHVAMNARDPDIMFKDPELAEIRVSLVEWELANKPTVPLGDVSIPEDLATSALGILNTQGGSLNGIIASGLRMFVRAHAMSTQEELTTNPEDSE